jgi:predicted TIM-barrel fold metal-dependent hydrolase
MFSESAESASRISRVKDGLDHPVVDADAHFQETPPVFRPFFEEYVKSIGGADMARRFRGDTDDDEAVIRPWRRLSRDERRQLWAAKGPFWAAPGLTIDRATAHIPRLMYERLGSLGIDFAVLYPTHHIVFNALPDREMRQVACRAINAFNAEAFGRFGDRMIPAALIPMHTPEEALAELNHAVLELGYKAVTINGAVVRPVGSSDADEGSPNAHIWGSRRADTRIDGLGLDPEFDYDPFWRRCIELGVAPASHSTSVGWANRRSISNYQFNQIGNFAAAMEATCRSLWMGGVTHRFPGLSFAFLEGGVAWACALFSDMLERWRKRNGVAIHQYDPANLDSNLLIQMFERYGDERFRPDIPGLIESFGEPEPEAIDEFAAMGVSNEAELADSFIPHFYFGCEGDDRLTAWAFNQRINPLGVKLRVMYSSDIGHWDVPDMSRALPEAWELVEEGLLSPEDFRDFTFTNVVRFYTAVNPDFFAGTAVEKEAATVVTAGTGSSASPRQPG